VRRRSLRSAFVVAMVLATLLLGATSRSAGAPTCTLTPVLREVAIDQGLPGYPRLVRGKETLVRPFFTLPSCADTANGANIVVRSATLAVKNGAALLTPTGGIATATAPLGPAYPLITTPSGATLPPDAAGNPIFVVPGSVLAAGSTGASFTATFEMTLTYAGQATNGAPYTTPDTTTTFTTPTGSRTAFTKPVEARTNALRILAVPMGGLLGADATTNLQNAMTTMSRIWPVPDGTVLPGGTVSPRTGDLFHAVGGIRYSVNAAPVDLTGLLDPITGKFCGNSTNWTSVKSQLAQFLQTWNSTNTNAQADRVSGVGDPLTTTSNTESTSCAEGMASVISPESWFRASADKGGPTLSMEMCHTFGCVPSTRSDGSYHSIYPNADFTTGDSNRGYNVTDRTYLSDDKNAMRYAATWTNANAIFGRDDFAMMLCKLGGATTTDCTKSNVAGTSSGVAAGVTTVSFVMSGTTDGTKAGTKVLESFKAATLPTPSDSSSQYRLRQFAGATQVADDGVPVSVEDSVHNAQGGHDESPGVFSIAFPLKSNTNKIQLINTAAPNPPLYEAIGNQAPAISAPSLTLLRSAQAPISSASTISVSPSIEKMFAPVHARLPRRVLSRGSQAGAFAPPTGLFWARRADGATYQVNSNVDPGDGTCDGTCTLRDAIIASNASTGATDTIAFNLPDGSLTITPEFALPAITRPVVIDGTTQPGYTGTPIVELSGATVSGGATIEHGLVINAGNTTVRGLVINRFSKPGDEGIDIGPASSANSIEGNYIGTDVAGTSALGNSYGIVVRGSNATVGGTTAGTRNVVSGNAQAGVRIEGGGTGNVVQGNYIGTKANGTEALGNGGSGVEIVDGSFNTIGGLTAEARNTISGNGTNVQLVSGTAHDNVVWGNYIGTDANGTVALGGAGSGVEVFASAHNNQIGGSTAQGRNVISGNGGRGVLILDTGTTGNLVDNNYIGLDATGTAKLANGVYGVQIQGAGANTVRGNAITGNAGGVVIGGAGVTTAGQVIDSNAMGTNASGATVLGQLGAGVAISNSSGSSIISNIIAGHTDVGILIDPFGGTATGNSIRYNSIKENAGIGIDLAPRGVTANDAGDADTGANDLQNFPVLSSVTRGATSTTIQGTLNSTPSTAVQLDFFSNATCDSSGYGEGATLLGSQNVTTDSGGNFSFTFTTATTINATDSVTATATTGNNTSEFSACRQAAAAASADLSITKADSPDPVGLGNDLTYTLTVRNIGPNTANAVQVVDTLPASVRFVSDSSSQGTCSGSATVTCALGDLANGGTATVTIVVETSAAGSITNQATVESSTSDPNSDNNSANAATAVEPAGGGGGGAGTGTNLRHIDADQAGTACATKTGTASGPIGVGVAFDGSHLLVSCYNDSTITVVNPANGAQVSHYTVAGATNLGALAWDKKRSLIWGCSNFSTVGQIDPTTHTFTAKFTVPGCFDGLAYDGADDTIWTSPDATSSITHSQIDGTGQSTHAVTLGTSGNSGIAVGGANLYLANDGGQEIYTSPKDFSSPPALFASFPARLEDLECDDMTFASQGDDAIWSVDAYDNELNAWEVPRGTCGFGGGEAGQSISYTATDADTDSCLLKSDLLLKHPDGTFDVLAVGLTPTTCGSPATFNFTASVGCQGCEIDAKVYDGFASSPMTKIANSTETDTIPTDPVAAINSPESGASVLQYDPVTLNGSGWDAQDGVLPGGKLTWSAPCLFTGTRSGTSLYLSPPTGGWTAPNSCTVSLYATDSNTHQSPTVSRTFTILADADHDKIPASLDVKCPPNVGSADNNPLNDRADDDGDGIPNGQDPAPCDPATTYNAIATFQPDPLDVTSSGNTVSMLVQVPYRDLKQVLSTSVAITVTVNEFSTKLTNVSWMVNSNGTGNAQFNRQDLLRFLAINNIHNRRILITISGNTAASVTPTPWSFQGVASTYIKG